MTWWRVVRAGVFKNGRLAVTYPSWLLNRLVGPIVWVAIGVYSYTALVPASDVRAAFAAAGESPQFQGFLILGQSVFTLFATLNFRAGMAVQRERWQGTLEAVLLAPASRTAYLLGEAVYGIVESGWSVLLAILVTAAWFSAGFSADRPLLAVLAVALTLAAMVAMSVFLAAFYVLTRSAGPLAIAMQTPIRFLSGASFPVSALPVALQAVAYALPVTWGLSAVRGAFLGGAAGEGLARGLLVLAAFTALFAVLGVVAVARMERVAKERGTLHEH